MAFGKFIAWAQAKHEARVLEKREIDLLLNLREVIENLTHAKKLISGPRALKIRDDYERFLSFIKRAYLSAIEANVQMEMVENISERFEDELKAFRGAFAQDGDALLIQEKDIIKGVQSSSNSLKTVRAVLLRIEREAPWKRSSGSMGELYTDVQHSLMDVSRLESKIVELLRLETEFKNRLAKIK